MCVCVCVCVCIICIFVHICKRNQALDAEKKVIRASLRSEDILLEEVRVGKRTHSASSKRTHSASSTRTHSRYSKRKLSGSSKRTHSRKGNSKKEPEQ